MTFRDFLNAKTDHPVNEPGYPLCPLCGGELILKTEHGARTIYCYQPDCRYERVASEEDARPYLEGS